MGWQVETLNAVVDAELEALPADMRAKFVRIAELLETFGPLQVREPYVKSLGNKLFEIRMKGKDGAARAIYVAASGQRVVFFTRLSRRLRRRRDPRSALPSSEQRRFYEYDCPFEEEMAKRSQFSRGIRCVAS